MNSRPLVLPYTHSLDVGVNEILQRFSFNRSARQLLSGDLALSGLYEQYLDAMNVFEYIKKHKYTNGQLVWVKRSMGDFKLFLVRCIIDENYSDLQYIVDQAYVEGATEQPEPDFDHYGWKNENFDLHIEDYGINERLRRYFVQRFAKHERDDSYHRFGALSGMIDADKKILLADLSNADKNREIIFYPYYTCKLDPDDVILYGYYRVWDCGTLELDFVYRLGYIGQHGSDGYDVDTVICNNFSMARAEYSNANTSKYFNTVKDRDIFAPLSCGQSEVDNIMQVNRNDYVNTYAATVTFPQFRFNGKNINFVDGQYMIFGSDVMSQDADIVQAQIEPSANCMAYCNKSKRGFTALYITYPDKTHFSDDKYNAQNGGLVSNSFHCHIVGRWVEEAIQV